MQKEVLKCFLSSAYYLQRKLSLANVVLRRLNCLKPALNTDSDSNELVINPAKQPPCMCNDINYIGRVSIEWLLYQNDWDFVLDYLLADDEVVTINK